MKRDEILDDAKYKINGPRAKDYGDAWENHENVAKTWSVILKKDVSVNEVYLCLLALKMCRLIVTPHHEESAVDICGYGALLGEGKIKD